MDMEWNEADAQVLGAVRRVLANFSFENNVCSITKNVLVSPVRCGPFQASMNRIENACGYVDDWNLEAILPLFFDIISNYCITFNTGHDAGC